MEDIGQAKKHTLLLRILNWREKHIPERIFLGILAFITGIVCSVAAALLKGVIHLIQGLVMKMNTLWEFNYFYLVTPIIGILLSGLFVKYILKQDIGHGITKVLQAVSLRKSRIKTHNTWSSLLASSVTIGLGGSVGAEAPIVLTGSAIGSNIGRFFRLEHGSLMLLVGCGAAGAVAGIFKAPITGLIFVIEVLMMDLTLTSVLPLLISSVTAATMSYFFFGMGAMFDYVGSEPFTLTRMPYVFLLGVASGFIALYFVKMSLFLEGKLRTKSYPTRFVICGTLLSLLIFIFPPLYGEGYSVISDLLGGETSDAMNESVFALIAHKSYALPLFIGLIIFFKVFATVATNSGGGSGGVFAPTLFVGALLGFLYSYLSNEVSFTPYLPVDNFILMGMAGLMAGVMHAPLTATFLIAELSGGYNLFLPLLVVSMTSYGISRIFITHNIYALHLAQSGQLVTHSKDQAVLTLMDMGQVLENDFIILHPDMTLGEAVESFSKAESTRFLMPVVQREDNHLVGIVSIEHIRNIMFRPELYDRFKVNKIMEVPPKRVLTSMSMEEVMHAFEESKAWNLPVEDPNGAYVGFVSKSKIFNIYREVLNDNFGGD